MSITASIEAKTWRRFTPRQRLARFAVYLTLVVAIVLSARTVEVIPEFLVDAPEQMRDLLQRMWPLAWAHDPRGGPEALVPPLPMPTLGEIIRESQIWKSIIRHPAPVDRRNRIVVMLTNFFLHLHPVSIKNTGIALSYMYYIAMPWLPDATIRRFSGLHALFYNKWYFDELYDAVFVKPSLALGRFLWKKGDAATIDGLGPDNVAARAQDMAGMLMRFQSGYLYHYAFVMLVGVAGLVTYFMLSAW